MATGLADQAERLLTDAPRVAHLATCHDGAPHVAPLWYNVHAGRVEVATTGRKLANLREHPRVALSVQHAEGGSPVWGVTVQGTATVLEDDEGGRAVIRRINRRYGADEDAWEDNTAVVIDVGTSAAWQY